LRFFTRKMSKNRFSNLKTRFTEQHLLRHNKNTGFSLKLVTKELNVARRLKLNLKRQSVKHGEKY
jgi:hypothetical protein